ncbi:MAG: hypothetical protein K0U41_00065 [Gammaproteobacteria bacterium]|nr:hypothetical protein [Gammaproteobacteria bacterium]
MAEENDLIIAEGTKVAVSLTLAPNKTGESAPTETEYAAVTTFNNVGKIKDLPTPDSTRTPSREPTLDEGEIVGAGTTTRSQVDFVTLAVKGRTQGYKDLVTAYNAKPPQAVDVKHTFTDGTVKYYRAHVTGAQESAPIGGNFQMAVGLAVQGDVITVYGSDS